MAEPSHPHQRNQMRQQLRAKRRSLSKSDQARAAQKLTIRLGRSPFFRGARTIAFYWPSDGEISPLPLMNLALAQGKQCYLPVVDAETFAMEFRRYRRGETLRPNRFGIPEPDSRAPTLPAQQLDLVLLPLVGFDRQGNRLGMGGGFYDRAFAKLRHRRPMRLGLAHSLQQLPRLDSASWDIPLQGICTERALRLLWPHAR